MGRVSVISTRRRPGLWVRRLLFQRVDVHVYGRCLLFQRVDVQVYGSGVCYFNA